MKAISRSFNLLSILSINSKGIKQAPFIGKGRDIDLNQLRHSPDTFPTSCKAFSGNKYFEAFSCSVPIFAVVIFLLIRTLPDHVEIERITKHPLSKILQFAGVLFAVSIRCTPCLIFGFMPVIELNYSSLAIVSG